VNNYLYKQVEHDIHMSIVLNLQSVYFELLCTALVLYAGGRPVTSCKFPIQASMVGVSNSFRSYPSRPIFILVAICSLAMC